MTPTLLNNRYRVLQNLGAGGFGNTFLAEDTYMPSARRCVIKQLKPVTHDPQTYKLVQERFQREAAVLEDLGEGSNQIPDLYAYFSEAGQFYLVQEYIEGDTLTKKVEKGGKVSDNEVKQILVSLLSVLDYVHSRRIVHRDIKPDNVIIRKRDGLPVLIDFGAVKEAMNTVVNDPGNSAPSIVIGTSGFMPAEQAGGRPTFASDLYALGLTAVFLLTGKVPQDLPTDDRTGEILWSQYAPNINPNLAKVIDRAIRFNVRDRFGTAREMLNALQSPADAASEMATQIVSPGGVPHPGNGSTPPIKNPSPPQTVPVGRSPVVQPADQNRPFIIAALIVGGVLLAGLALSAVLRRSPDPSSPVASDSSSTREQQTTQQPSSSTPSSSPSGPSDSQPTTEPSPSRTPSSSRSGSSNSQPTTEPSPSRTSSTSRSPSSNSQPTTEPSTREQPSSSTTSGSTSRSQPSGNTPSPVVGGSSSGQKPQAPSSPRDRSLPPQPIPVPSPEAENNNQNSNQSRKIPGFAPGTQQSYVKEELGKPTKVSSGYWKTRALLYEDVVPGKVDLGYLYDPSSGRVRQTEASFSDSVELKMMSGTLDKMVNGNVSADIKQGLEAVYRGKSKRYNFVSGRDGSLKGVIERNEPGRIYVAVWEADLH